MTINKFTTADVFALRQQLVEKIPDPFEIAEILKSFLMCRGYGVCSNTALDAASKMGASGCSFSAVQAELEAVALVM